MPIVVDEVVISVEVVGGGAAGAGGAPGGDGDAGSVVEQCVERVLEVLKQRSER